jgi:hypothetical protein
MSTNRSSWGRVVVLACFLAFLLIGSARIMEFLYGIGLYPAVTQEEVVAQLKRTPNIEGLTCQQNVAGWEYVCEYVLRHHVPGSVSRHREGIRTSWMAPIGSRTLLPTDGPVLSEAEHARWLEEQRRKDRERAQPVNLRTATLADLRRILPASDPYLAEQIHAAVRSGTVSSVDDLLKLKGMDRHRLDLIRSKVRWE